MTLALTSTAASRRYAVTSEQAFVIVYDGGSHAWTSVQRTGGRNESHETSSQIYNWVTFKNFKNFRNAKKILCNIDTNCCNFKQTIFIAHLFIINTHTKTLMHI